MNKFALIFSFVLACLLGVSLENEESKNPIAQTLENLAEDDKEDFLSFVYGLGLLDWAKSRPRPPKFFPPLKEEAFLNLLNITQDKIEKFRNLNIPEESRMQLLLWTEKEFNMGRGDILQLIKSKKCSKPECVSLRDIGTLCCPW